MMDHWFWWLTTAACVVWYSTITFYVGIKGALDIKGMIGRLEAQHLKAEEKNKDA